MIICCARCDKAILDKFLLTVLDQTWHAECVRCVDCGLTLSDKCFSREGKLFCRTDFFRRFGTKCSGCLQGISPQDLVRKARDRVFHLKCFTCCVCRKQLSTGEELYVLDENKFICKEDYLNGKPITDTFGSPTDDEDDDNVDVKPSLHNLPTLTPPTSTTPSISASPLGIPPVLSTSNVLSPSSHTMSHSNSPLIGPPPTSSLVGLLGRTTPPGSHLGLVGTPTPVPGHESLCGSESKISSITGFNIGLTDTPPSEKDSSNFPDSDASDVEGSGEAKDGSCADGSKQDDDKSGNKRRGPRTTIKAKQLEVLKTAFAATPKPTRHIREQLAKETGLPMRVIQVWFQNKRSKERRMKQLSSMGMRAHLFANPRKLRGMRMSPGLDDGYGYYGDAFGYGPQGFHEFFPGQGPPPPGMGFPHGIPPAMEQPLPPGGPMGEFPMLGGLSGPPISEGPFLNPPPDLLSQRSSPENMILTQRGQGSFDHQSNEGLVW